MNNYNLYSTYEFWFYAKKYKIILFCLTPHSIYFTQLLNIRFFQTFKHYQTNAIKYIVWLKNIKFGKLQFLEKFQTLKEKTFIKPIIYSL